MLQERLCILGTFLYLKCTKIDRLDSETDHWLRISISRDFENKESDGFNKFEHIREEEVPRTYRMLKT